MRQERSYRGWLAAVTVAASITSILIYVEKQVILPGEDFWALAKRVSAQVGGSTKWQGILLEEDAGLVGTVTVSPSHHTSLHRRTANGNDAVDLLRRPPELSSTAFLREPVTAEDFVSLPLSNSPSSLNALLDSMDEALRSPMSTVSLQTQAPDESAALTGELVSRRFDELLSPAELAGKMPLPARLLDELAALRLGAHGSVSSSAQQNVIGVKPQVVAAELVTPQQLAQIQLWINQVEKLVHTLVEDVGLENPACKSYLQELAQLSEQGRAFGEQLTDHHWAAAILRTSYSLQRRVIVWSSIESCLDGTSIGLVQPNKGPQSTKQEVAAAVAEVEAAIADASDRQGWRKYLLLEGLARWAATEQEQWRVGNQLARSYLSRVYWGRLNDKQRDFLQNEAVSHLAQCMSSWGRDPIDYRHLLMSLEQIEQEPTNRLVFTVADTVQILRHSQNPHQKHLAETMNTHYRNANLRLTISQQMIERFLPNDEIQVRPVRQRILGADTAGDSTVLTDLAVKFHPDPNSWNVELGIRSNLVSSTRSSKGPAVFHNTGVAQVDSQRFLKMTPTDFSLTSEPAQVNSSDRLQKLSTDYDGLPVIGDFVRMVVREQFNQKRGLARRITQRIIARETDAEIDRQLSTGLQRAERELNDRILGPLQRLTLDPMVVSMSTTADRLTIRYRLAQEMQLGAHTSRPRAPTECLTSFQVHQTVLNNAIDNVGLSGKDWRLADLYQSLGNVFQAQWAPPADVPEDISIRFADHRPITIEMENGKLRLQLRIAKFRRDGGININNFVVTSTYVPIAEGLTAALIRDPEGTVEIQSRHLPIGDRLALRVIFSKVFVSNPEIPLISEQWSQDSRSQGLAVSQLEIRDGWLAVAISETDSQLAAEIAQRTSAIKSIPR